MDQQVSGQHASSSYLKVVKRSHFISSDKVLHEWNQRKSIYISNAIVNNFIKERLKVISGFDYKLKNKVVRLMDEVESVFTKHFANNDRKKAMKFLRPHQQKDSHVVTFFVGNILFSSVLTPFIICF